MAHNPEKNNEHLDHPSRGAVEKSQRESVEIKEVVENTEVSEFIDTEISEELGEGKKKVSGGMKSSVKTDGKVLADDDASLPQVDVMRIQIATQLKKEIVNLEKQAARMICSPGKFEPFHLNQVVSNIRYLKDILANLAHSTTETVKSLWQKYIKGKAS